MLRWIQELSLNKIDAVCELLAGAEERYYIMKQLAICFVTSAVWWKVFSPKLSNIQECLLKLSSFLANNQLPSLKRWCLMECVHCRRERIMRFCDHYWQHQP